MRGDPRLRTPTDHDPASGALNQVGGRLDEQRRKLKLTQDGLCARIEDVTGGRWRPTRRDVYKLEQGTRSVTDLELLALSVALECDPIWLFTGDESAIDYASKVISTWQQNPLSPVA